MRCENEDRDCQWEGTVGELSVHVASCDYALVPCPRECGDHDVTKLVTRKDLAEHLGKLCPKRDHKCIHCDKKGTSAGITQVHDQICEEKKKVSCLNLECEHTVGCQGVKRHLESSSYSEIPCKYRKLGCETVLMRRDMENHEEASDKLHVHLALEKLVSLQEDIAHLRDNQTQHLIKLMSVEECMNSIAFLRDDFTLKKGESFTFKLSGYELKKLQNERFTSPAFYIAEGYHLNIKVDSNGRGGKGEYISFFVHSEDGKYDCDLTWPFVANCTFELLNHLDDRNHYCCEQEITFYRNTDMGIEYFCPHSVLGHDPVKKTQYLKDDTLYFRVSIDPLNHKLWLKCSK